MVKALKVKKKKGQRALDWLGEKGWLNTNYRLGKTKKYLFIPLHKSASTASVSKKLGGKIVKKNLKKRKTSGGDLKDKLAKVIPKKYIPKVHKSFDVVGTIAVLDVPDELAKLEKSIAWTVLRTTPGVETVAKRATTTKGKHRVRKVKVLVGEKTTETVHKENGVRLKLDLNKVYFSERFGTERLRIAKKVKPNERVLVMFAGVGPFSLVINKQQPAVKQIVSVEVNKDACEYLRENIRLNCNIYKQRPSKKKSNASKRAERAKPAAAVMASKHKTICGDAAKEVPKLRGKFDRVVMPLPKQAKTFLKPALKVAKKGAIIHLYIFAHENEIKKKAKAIAKKHKLKLQHVERCGAYAPGVNRYCLDLKVV